MGDGISKAAGLITLNPAVRRGGREKILQASRAAAEEATESPLMKSQEV
jgi:undecaprenyl pyrophosphate synthase